MVAAAVIGSAVVGAAASSYSSRRASNAQTAASRDAIAAQQDSENRALEMQRPFYEAGYAATAAMMDMTGLSRGSPNGSATSRAEPTGFDMQDMAHGTVTRSFRPRTSGDAPGAAAGAGSPAGPADPTDLSSYAKYNWQQDPGYQFRMDEGTRALERSASARGILNSGGTLRSATRYAQDYASNEYQRVFDRISTIAGHGQGAANTGSNVILNTGANTGRAIMNAGDARASGYVAQGNAWSNAANQISVAYGSGMFGSGNQDPYAGRVNGH